MQYETLNTPSIFQAFINNILRDMLGKFVIAYTNDIMICSCSLKAHVMYKPLENQHFVKRENGKFHMPKVT